MNVFYPQVIAHYMLFSLVLAFRLDQRQHEHPSDISKAHSSEGQAHRDTKLVSTLPTCTLHQLEGNIMHHGICKRT